MKCFFFKLIIFLFLLLFILYNIKNEYKIYLIKKGLKSKIELLPDSKKKILNDYATNIISPKYELDKLLDTNNLAQLLSLTNYSEIVDNTKKNELKLELFNELQTEKQNKKILNNSIIYLNTSFKYGNTMILLNNLLYYTEILNITTIYLNSDMNWPIKDNISYTNLNITIIPPTNINFKDEKIICFNPNFIYYQKVIIPEIRINKLKNEIYKNLPKINIDDKDLYIHVRGGDIFMCERCEDINYSQPPLCFYKKILNNFRFKNIYIISIDNLNPIIEPLIKEFPKIIHTNNSIQRDIAILSNAYNLVGSVSSFLITSILMNDNLKNYFEYDNYRLTEKYLHLHPQIYKYKITYNVYKMNSSKYYRSKMFPWKNTKFQLDLMLREKCDDFNEI